MPSCVTVDNVTVFGLNFSSPEPSMECSFPFLFHGVEYRACTVADGSPHPWCSTLTDKNGVHVGGKGKWGYCQENCTKDTRMETGIG